MVGQAMDFDGTDDTISVAADASLDIQTGSFTIACWVRVDVPATPEAAGGHLGHGIIENKPASGASDSASGYMLQVVNEDHYPDSRGRRNEVVFVYGDGSGINTTGGATLGCGPWYHIAVTFDSSTNTVTMYHDGDEWGSNSFSTAPVDNNHPVQIGTHHQSDGTVDRWLDGALSEVRLYNRALSAAEIDALAAVGNGPSPSFDVVRNQEIFDVESDPMLIYESGRSPPYLLSVFNTADDNSYGTDGNNLWESSDRINWTLVQDDITGTSHHQDYVRVDGTYYVYDSDDTDTNVWTGADMTSLTLDGTVLSGLADVGAFYDSSESTYYLFPEEEVTGVSGDKIGIYTSSSGTSGFSRVGTALDFADRPYGTGDVDIELINGTYWMFFDVTTSHPHYGTGLAKSDDLLNWEFVTDSIKDDLGGDLDVLETPDGIFGVSEFSGTGTDGVSLWDITQT